MKQSLQSQKPSALQPSSVAAGQRLLSTPQPLDPSLLRFVGGAGGTPVAVNGPHAGW